MSLLAVPAVLLATAVSLFAAPGAVAVTEAATSLTITAEPEGRFTVEYGALGWVFAGDTGQPFSNLATSAGSDGIGSYQAVLFTYSVDSAARQVEIRTYSGRPVVLFRVTYLAASNNIEPFPTFNHWPSGLHPFGFESWNYTFALDRIEAGSPWLQFDSTGNAFLLSPASNFIVSGIKSNGTGIESGIDPAIATLHANLEHSTLLAFGTGINAVFDTWGRALTDLHGKVRPAADADVSLARAGLWTDNRSPYYYNPGEAGQGLIDAVNYYRGAGIRLGYIQADSWWYPKGMPPSWKNNGTGLYRLRADLDLFPDDLSGFHQRSGAPLVVHSRYWHESSPDRSEYAFSGNVPIDPLYWRDLAAYLARSGVEVFEQDWLTGPAVTDRNLHDPDAFFDNMAQAMAERGIHMQYSMPRPHHFLQGAKYSNLTSIRASADGLARDRWDSLLFDSRLASALGIWPFTDNFCSDNVRNVLLAALSAGPFGPADEIGKADVRNLKLALRPDGVVVKPDSPLVPTDRTYLALVQDPSAPMVASTASDFGALKAAYVFAYGRQQTAEAVFSPESLGIQGRVYPYSLVYDFFAHTGEIVQSGSEIRRTVDADGAYFVVVPLGPSGMAFLGDTSKFVTLGKQRISRLDDDGAITATVEFGPGEHFVTLEVFSPSPLTIVSDRGFARVFGASPDRQRYRVLVRNLGNPSVTLGLSRRGAPSTGRERSIDRPLQFRASHRGADE